MKLFPTLLLSALSLSVPLHACEICNSYVPRSDHRFSLAPELHPVAGFPLFATVAEQFTHFGSLRLDGHEVPNPADQYLDSSTTQLIFGSTFFQNRLSLQINIPLIARAYKRPEGTGTEWGNESGLGDISLLASLSVFQKEALFHPEDCGCSIGQHGLSKDGKATLAAPHSPDFSISFNLIAGLKLPTGDSSRLKEEFSEGHTHGGAAHAESHSEAEHEEGEAEHEEGAEHEELAAHPEPPESGIHGHDLALGSGSYDAIFGAQFFVRYKAVFLQAETQFTLRGDGRHSYHFANDLAWSGGPGIFLIRNDRCSLALQAVVSGETKDTDRFQGRTSEDTGLTTLYVGPRISARFGRFSGDVGLDLPCLIDNTALQAVPDYRIRAALSFQF